MAVQRETYGLPDEMLQLIAASPELSMPMMQQGSAAQFATPDERRSDLISALRTISGPANPGFTRYANAANGSALTPTARKQLNVISPARLTLAKYIAPDVVLPGGETKTIINTPVVDKLIYDDILGDEVIDDEVIDDPVDDPLDDPLDPLDPDLPVPPDLPVGTPIIDVFPTGTQVTVDGGTGNDTIVGGTGNDTITGGGGNDGPNLESSIAAILAARLAGTGGTGGTGGGDGGSGTGGTGGLTGTGTTGGTGTTTTTGTTSGTGSTSGTGDSLRDAITAAVDGTGASIDNSSAGLDTSSASSTLGSSLTADQLSALTKPKVPSVTLESSGPALDDKGSLIQTFDYPELLSSEDLKAYEEWMKQSSGMTGGGGKPQFNDISWGELEF